MAISVFPPPTASSAIKSIQRGVAVAAGTITISAVTPGKTVVSSFSTGSAGTVAARGSVTGDLLPSGGNIGGSGTTSGNGGNSSGAFANYAASNMSISGGTTSLTSAVYGAYLTSATTIEVTGPCRYEITEYN